MTNIDTQLKGKKKKSPKKKSVYKFIELNQPSPEAIDALHKCMYNTIKQSRTAGKH
ncbi:hypothetical protein [Sporomusa sp.]|uniref:hypothetical protein n=1 Tax=Sporomusa sp. TaxID=2078658 RepID=UPI002D8095ED|nr:hypothetical protein [Sporomusa sp.]